MPTISYNKASRLEFMRRCAAEGMVLLADDAKNLPFGYEKVAVFGRSQIDTIKGGTGSGFVYCRHTVSLLEGLRASRVNLYEPLASVYEEWVKANPKDDGAGSVWGSGEHSYPEMPLDNAVVKDAAENCEKAIIIISRISGENFDMRLKKGDHYLTDGEEAMISAVSACFKHIVLLVNTGAPIDLSCVDKYSIETVLYMGQAGEQTGAAVASILDGSVNPSGKCTQTWAVKYEDYPSPKGFFGKEVVYREGIYVGYRYFDSFGIQPRYPFGHGLSYTTFDIKTTAASVEKDVLSVTVCVKNTGSVAGKEVVELYSSSPERLLEKPYQELRAFHKTALLEPGESDEYTFRLPLSELASYSTELAAYILEHGRYIIRIGNSSRNTVPAVAIDFGSRDGYTVTRQCKNLLTPTKKFREIKKPESEPTFENCAFELSVSEKVIKKEVCKYTEKRVPEELKPKAGAGRLTLFDVKEGRATVEDVVAQMSDEELSRFANGHTESDDVPADDGKGLVVGASSRTVMGAAGETWSSDKYKMPTSVVADGPAGVRLNLHVKDSNELRYCSAFPIGMLLAGTWNEDIAWEMGRRISHELTKYGIDAILGPGINIVKNPLCGRSFEYFSEDPYLSGMICAAEVTGVQKSSSGNSGTYATIKHLAANSQENHRVGGNSVVSERTMREIYLKAFEIAVKKAQPRSIMTSYNRLNGVFTANEFELCSDIVRSEWGFKGFFMTDWGGLEDAALCMSAGNDIIMAGWKAWHIKQALDNGSLERSCVQRSVVNILKAVIKTNSFKKLYRSERK